MQKLKQQIKDKKLSNVYLFYGEERYIINTYLNKIVELALEGGDKSMNYDIYETRLNNIDKIIDSIATLPFFSSKRVIVIKDYNLFKSKNSNDVAKLQEAIIRIPDTTLLIIIEEEVDKRTKLYKLLSKNGTGVEFNRLSDGELIKYIASVLNKYGKKIDKDCVKHFIQTVGYDLQNIHNELDKVIDYNENSIIIKQSIDEVCIRTIESRIFDLVDCMGSGNKDKALKLYYDLIISKEHPTKILFMLTRQFRLIYQTKLLYSQGFDKNSIARKIKIPPFVANKCIKQSSNFTLPNLKQSLNECLEIEKDIKTGKIDSKIGIELIIIKYSI
jgi:DNA polymerase-3 subunit delta